MRQLSISRQQNFGSNAIKLDILVRQVETGRWVVKRCEQHLDRRKYRWVASTWCRRPKRAKVLTVQVAAAGVRCWSLGTGRLTSTCRVRKARPFRHAINIVNEQSVSQSGNSSLCLSWSILCSVPHAVLPGHSTPLLCKAWHHRHIQLLAESSLFAYPFGRPTKSNDCGKLSRSPPAGSIQVW